MRHTHARKATMTRHFVDSSVRLNTGELLDIDDGEGFTVECLDGAVWITQSSDPRDIVLKAGESFVLDKPGRSRSETATATTAGPAAAKLPAHSACGLADSEWLEPAWSM
jgi:hypothetical protein